MEQSEAVIEQLVVEAAHYLEKMEYSDPRIKQYHAAWNHLKIFMVECGEDCYSASIGDKFIYGMIGIGAYEGLSSWQKQIISCVNVLTENLETGTVKFRRCKKFRELSGPVGTTMLEYIRYRKGYGISAVTEDYYKYHLGQFIVYLGEKGIGLVDEMNNLIIIHFANSTGFA